MSLLNLPRTALPDGTLIIAVVLYGVPCVQRVRVYDWPQPDDRTDSIYDSTWFILTTIGATPLV